VRRRNSRERKTICEVNESREREKNSFVRRSVSRRKKKREIKR